MRFLTILFFAHMLVVRVCAQISSIKQYKQIFQLATPGKNSLISSYALFGQPHAVTFKKCNVDGNEDYMRLDRSTQRQVIKLYNSVQKKLMLLDQTHGISLVMVSSSLLSVLGGIAFIKYGYECAYPASIGWLWAGIMTAMHAITIPVMIKGAVERRDVAYANKILRVEIDRRDVELKNYEMNHARNVQALSALQDQYQVLSKENNELRQQINNYEQKQVVNQCLVESGRQQLRKRDKEARELKRYIEALKNQNQALIDSLQFLGQKQEEAERYREQVKKDYEEAVRKAAAAFKELAKQRQNDEAIFEDIVKRLTQEKVALQQEKLGIQEQLGYLLNTKKRKGENAEKVNTIVNGRGRAQEQLAINGSPVRADSPPISPKKESSKKDTVKAGLAKLTRRFSVILDNKKNNHEANYFNVAPLFPQAAEQPIVTTDCPDDCTGDDAISKIDTSLNK